MEAQADDLTEKCVVPRAAASAEMIAIRAVGVMLTGVVLTTNSWIRDEVQALRSELRDGRILSEPRERSTRVESDLNALRERVVRVEERLVKIESDLGEVHERVIRIESVLLEDSIGRHA